MLSGRGLSFAYASTGRRVLAEASIEIPSSRIVGLLGPSGSGKSTLGRILAGLVIADTGTVTVDGRPLPQRGRLPVQMLFQTPELAVNPRWRVGHILSEAFSPDEGLLASVGVRPAWRDRFPHELSGGELQRVAIARALGPATRYLVADEISGMLDAITQAELWKTLLLLSRERGIGILAISHDRALLGRIATATFEMDAGQCKPTELTAT